MKTYEDGLNEAWGCARKIIANDGLPVYVIEDIFNIDSLDDVFKKCQPQDAIKKIKEWETSFKVGDIVVHGNVKAVVTNVDKETEFFRIMYADGRSEAYKPQDMVWVKTGKRINVQNIMEALK